MKYETIEDLKRVEDELTEVDRLLDQEDDVSVKGAIQETAVALAGGGVGIAGGGVALFFAGVTGFSAVGITSGLAAIGAIVGGGMIAGIGLLAAGPVLLAGGGYLGMRYLRQKKFNDARSKLREHVLKRRDFLHRLVTEKSELGEKLGEYRVHLDRLNRMITDLDASADGH